jgi:murein DD-endopeptidase MepM/ murein hydrolase activator NlpD
MVATATLLMLAMGLPIASASAADPEPMSAERGMAVAEDEETIPAPEVPWLWPVNVRREVTEPFRAPAHDYGPGHRGMDIAAAPGAVVHAPADGVVAFRGVVVDRPLLTIDHGSGFVTTFEPLESALAAGDAVSVGDEIGTVAVGGHTEPGAMHLGVRWNGAYINPMPLFGEVPRAVLLPCCDGR